MKFYGTLTVNSFILGFLTLTSVSANVMHPEIALLDAQERNVLESGAPVSPMKTCGFCHDTTYIEQSSTHALVGWDRTSEPGTIATGKPWDSGIGLYGRWDPGIYQVLDSSGATHREKVLKDWAQSYGRQHVGGGPTLELGQEMNCFLCHLGNADNSSRLSELAAGNFAWVATATLLQSGVVTKGSDGFQYARAEFTSEGKVKRENFVLSDPRNTACGFCHGYVHAGDLSVQIELGSGDLSLTEYRGSVYAGQRLRNSALNLQHKEQLDRTWDTHAERLLNCTSCHYSLNNPLYRAEAEQTKPQHLKFDGRRLALHQYLYQPMHRFAKGQSSYFQLEPEFKAAMRRCESCHDTAVTHEWLPYKERHFDRLSCESCHIPYNHFTAREQIDWTAIHATGQPLLTYHNVEERVCNPHTYFKGFAPVLLTRKELDGKLRLAPYNLVSAYYWVHGEPELPVSLEQLTKVYLVGAEHHPMILAVFDRDGDGLLSDLELRVDTEQKLALVKDRLQQLGLESPRIKADVQAYGIHHGVTHGEWATQDCAACHSRAGRLGAEFELAAYTPGGVIPSQINGVNVVITGSIEQTARGAVILKPNNFEATDSDYYVLGASRVPRINRLGGLIVILVIAGVLGHGGLRYIFARMRRERVR